MLVGSTTFTHICTVVSVLLPRMLSLLVVTGTVEQPGMCKTSEQALA
jgi:hypothetical protein